MMVDVTFPLAPIREGKMPAWGYSQLHFSDTPESRCRKGANLVVVIHLAFQPVNNDDLKGCRTQLGLRGGLVTMGACNHTINSAGPALPLGDVTETRTTETGVAAAAGVRDASVSMTGKDQTSSSFVVRSMSQSVGKDSVEWTFKSNVRDRFLDGMADVMTAQLTAPEQPRPIGCSCKVTLSTVAADWYGKILETPMDISWLKTVFLKVRLASILKEIVRVNREGLLLSGQWICERPCTAHSVPPLGERP